MTRTAFYRHRSPPVDALPATFDLDRFRMDLHASYHATCLAPDCTEVRCIALRSTLLIAHGYVPPCHICGLTLDAEARRDCGACAN
jgi:hypothetical protein